MQQATVCKYKDGGVTNLSILLNERGTTVGSHGGEHVEVEGSFDNWTTRQTMQRSGKDFTIVKLLPPGVYQVSRQL